MRTCRWKRSMAYGICYLAYPSGVSHKIIYHLPERCSYYLSAWQAFTCLLMTSQIFVTFLDHTRSPLRLFGRCLIMTPVFYRLKLRRTDKPPQPKISIEISPNNYEHDNYEPLGLVRHLRLY
ncbi:hypothetical protein MPTK1_7g18440 [Marchantia polymorpha subsp. ruderalis]|uniref:Uncharacterized protein n=2 Tax=Marchantia polymorpha TaxID=3197 RepID=A0AAF6C140_MARPO|nr:hypothetical protein MARPO_0165s0004 [Marchantia polymorpha]BBN17974.1 hypothetical protein Mp_7g18440 [Marchantia polymorpha subsp. ruderalis]|eukprot:PTQ28374.1 hypothetical protein MARPO_0165s0004 [Marchantia polymorpha]